MTLRLLSLYALFTFYSFSINAQDPAIEWQNTIGGSNWDTLWSLTQTSDGGYVVGGWSASDISGDKTEDTNGTADFWVLKLDNQGEIVWQNSIGGNNADNLYSLVETIDGGFLLGGRSNSDLSGDKTEESRGGSDFWIVKINADGEVLWDKTYGGTDYDHLWNLQQTTDGGFILGGFSRSDISGDKTEDSKGSYDFWIIRIDAEGEILWQNTIGGDGFDELKDLAQTADGGFILGGESESGISGDKTDSNRGLRDYWIVKVDENGEVLWDTTIGGLVDDDLKSIIQTTDGGYLIAGDSSSQASGDKSENSLGEDDYWMVKLNASGDLIWENTIGGDAVDRSFVVMENNAGNYIIGGYSSSRISSDKTEENKGGPDYWFVETDTNGNVLAQNTIGGVIADIMTDIQQTDDGGYIIGGYSFSDDSFDKTENTNGFWDLWIVKMSVLTLSSPDFSNVEVKLYPNPVKDYLSIASSEEIQEVVIYSVLGSKVFQSTNASILDLSALESGVYLIEINTQNKKSLKKFVKS